MLTELLYPLQDGSTPLHLGVKGGHVTCVEHLLSTPGIEVNIKINVSWSIEIRMLHEHYSYDNTKNSKNRREWSVHTWGAEGGGGRRGGGAIC